MPRGQENKSESDLRLQTCDCAQGQVKEASREASGTDGFVFDGARASAALRASEVRYRRLFESARDGILILDHATAAIVDVNPFMCDLLGVPCEEILGRKLWDIGSFKDVPESKYNFRELQEKEYIRYDDLPLESAQGRKIAVEFVSNVYLVEGQKVIQCNVRDITQRKRDAEESARLALAVTQSAESIVMTDPEGAIVYVNPAFERISGWNRVDALGQNVRILKSGQHDANFYREMWAVLLRGETWTGRLLNRKRDGTTFEEEATISPMRDPSGTVVNYVAAKRDISEQVRLEQQLYQAQKLEAIGRLAAGIAHDFNNLLGVITGYGEIVKEGLAPADPLVEDVDQILLAAGRAATSTQQLLAFGRRQRLQQTIVDLNSVVNEAVALLRPLLGARVQLATRLAPALAPVRADSGQLNQVLMNLVLNARDAMPDGGQILIATRNTSLESDRSLPQVFLEPGRYVEMTVADTGLGMDAATQARVFEPFFTTKQTGKGTGLGLSAVHGIVHQSCGEVYVDTQVGVGTTFKVLLPMVEDNPVARPAGGGVRPAPRGNESILLVEDETGLRNLLAKVLRGKGYRVHVARDGSEALAIAEAHPAAIDILITDVIMPGLRGPRIAELLGASRPEMKVLYISGYSGESTGEGAALPLGAAFLGKPFGLAVLLRKVRELLDSN